MTLSLIVTFNLKSSKCRGKQQSQNCQTCKILLWYFDRYINIQYDISIEPKIPVCNLCQIQVYTPSYRYRGYSSFFYKYTVSFIEWCENKYFTNGDSHEWNMIIFIPQDENKSVFIEKNFSVYYILSVILNNNNSVAIKNWCLIYIIFLIWY